jgi:hypothetical protein
MTQWANSTWQSSVKVEYIVITGSDGTVDESSFNNWHCRLCDKEIRGTDKRDADRHV